MEEHQRDVSVSADLGSESVSMVAATEEIRRKYGPRHAQSVIGLALYFSSNVI